jgi:hypothetical protein
VSDAAAAAPAPTNLRLEIDTLLLLSKLCGGVNAAICEWAAAVGESEGRRPMSVASIRYGPGIASRYA